MSNEALEEAREPPKPRKSPKARKPRKPKTPRKPETEAPAKTAKPVDQMTAIERKEAICSKYIRTITGRPFSFEGREWQRDQLWLALEGWRLWPVDVPEPNLCPACSVIAGSLVETLKDVPHCGKKGCTKLEGRRITYIVVKLERRGGKTFGLSSWMIATLASGEPNFAALYIAAAGDQTDELFRDNWVGPVERSKDLQKKLEISTNRMTNLKTRSFVEIAPTSFRSITGRGKTLVVIDESRDIDARVAAALLPSIWAEKGYKCPKGHVRFSGEATVAVCGVCKSPLEPWNAQAILMSSAGILDGGSRDWFADLVDLLRKEPDPDYYLIDLDNPNPDISLPSRDAFSRVMGQIDSMKTFVHAEAGTEFLRKGEDYVPRASVEACSDQFLQMEEGELGPAIAFLDTSISKDLTSLVIAVPDLARLLPTEANRPWFRLRWSHIKSWDPSVFPGKTIDPAIIEAYVHRVLSGYPGLVAFDVDIRGSRVPWAQTFVDQARKKYAWGKVTKGWGFGKHEQLVRDSSYSIMQAMVLEGRTRWPRDGRESAIIAKEFAGLRLQQRPDGTWGVVDRERNIRHADIISGMAGVCWRAYQILTKPRGSHFSKTGLAKLDQVFDDTRHPIERMKF